MKFIYALMALTVFTAPACAADNMTALPADAITSEFVTNTGDNAGTVQITEHGDHLLLKFDLSNLTAGVHAIHIHEKGDCSPIGDKAFTNTGGHFNPTGADHGILNTKGMHAGDLPNFYAHAGGTAKFDVFAHGLSLNNADTPNLLDTDGSAFVIHNAADDYKSGPAGDAGPRIACATVK